MGQGRPAAGPVHVRCPGHGEGSRRPNLLTALANSFLRTFWPSSCSLPLYPFYTTFPFDVRFFPSGPPPCIRV